MNIPGFPDLSRSNLNNLYCLQKEDNIYENEIIPQAIWSLPEIGSRAEKCNRYQKQIRVVSNTRRIRVNPGDTDYLGPNCEQEGVIWNCPTGVKDLSKCDVEAFVYKCEDIVFSPICGPCNGYFRWCYPANEPPLDCYCGDVGHIKNDDIPDLVDYGIIYPLPI